MAGKAKWDAWKAVEGWQISRFLIVFFKSMKPYLLPYRFVRILIILANLDAAKSKEEAMTDYITKVKQLLEEAAAASTS
jgi:diazepam-binding inhibitor (GABA receptor modulating acyl-CoA-binding protein)